MIIKILKIKFSVKLKTESKMMIPVCHIMIMVISITRDLKKKNSIPFTVGKNLKSKEEVLIDVNIFSKGFEYYRVGSIDISPNNKIMAYSYDTLSRRLYTIKFINLETGKEIGKSITNTSGGVSWDNDNKTVFYDKKNIETLRNEKVFKLICIMVNPASFSRKMKPLI